VIQNFTAVCRLSLNWWIPVMHEFEPPSKAPIVSLSKKPLPLLLGTGWFQEWI